MTFLKNAWYAAAWSSGLGAEPMARTITGEFVVLYRRADGTPVALEDRCCHRALPLSLGRIEGDDIRCGYHGLRFTPTGACTEVPGQSTIPPGAEVRSYPVVERWHTLWIWMGDATAADEAAIPDVFWLDDPGWVPSPGYIHMNANYRLLVDNLLDLTHVTYLHTRTIAGDPSEGLVPVKTERDGHTVRVGRWMLDTPPPPMFADAGGFTGNVDRWQLITWRPPSTVVLDIGSADAGTGAPEGDRSRGISMWSTHLITPETETSTHYHWCYARNYALDDAAMTRLLYDGGDRTFNEDVAVLEAQQLALLDDADAPLVDINIDNAPLQARRIVDELVAAERENLPAPRDGR